MLAKTAQEVKEIIKDGTLPPSVLWTALRRLLGDAITTWEPDTFALELSRRGILPTAGLMTKILAAQTVLTTDVIYHDYEALFAFALACAGIAHVSEQPAHPSPFLLCVAIKEIEALAKKSITDDEGFDPDEIDPAIMGVLLFAGYCIAPEPLSFCEELLGKYSQVKDREAIRERWHKLRSESTEDLIEVADRLSETTSGVQLQRLIELTVRLRKWSEAREASLKSLNLSMI